MIRNSTQSAAARCSIASVAGRFAFRNVLMWRTASGIFSGTSFHGYRLTCTLGASIADSIATAWIKLRVSAYPGPLSMVHDKSGVSSTARPAPAWLFSRRTLVHAGYRVGLGGAASKAVSRTCWIAAAALNKEIAEGGEPTVSDRGHAAIDREVHACDEACFVRSEEQGGRCDLVRTAEPPERDGCGELGAGLVGPFLGRRLLLEDRRVDRAGADRIDPDATVLQLGRPRADEGADRRLGGTVGCETGDPLALGDRRNHDDCSAVFQEREGLLDRESQPASVDRKDPVETFLRGLGERLGVDDASAGEEDVELAFSLADLRVEPVEIGEV